MDVPATLASWTARARAELERLADELRRSDRFFKLRAGVVAGWVAITAITLVAACPPTGPGNSLGAEARVLRESFVGGSQVLVRNDSGEVWTDVVVTIDGEWRYRHPTLRSRDEIVVPTSQFTSGEAALAPDYRPRRVEVECRQGSSSFDVR
jgi:hypothetical protein